MGTVDERLGFFVCVFYNNLLKCLSHFDVDNRVVSFKMQAVTGSVFHSVYTVYFSPTLSKIHFELFNDDILQ